MSEQCKRKRTRMKTKERAKKSLVIQNTETTRAYFFARRFVAFCALPVALSIKNSSAFCLPSLLPSTTLAWHPDPPTSRHLDLCILERPSDPSLIRAHASQPTQQKPRVAPTAFLGIPARPVRLKSGAGGLVRQATRLCGSTGDRLMLIHSKSRQGSMRGWDDP
jgi:hypothetical protein